MAQGYGLLMGKSETMVHMLSQDPTFTKATMSQSNKLISGFDLKNKKSRDVNWLKRLYFLGCNYCSVVMFPPVQIDGVCDLIPSLIPASLAQSLLSLVVPTCPYLSLIVPTHHYLLPTFSYCTPGKPF